MAGPYDILNALMPVFVNRPIGPYLIGGTDLYVPAFTAWNAGGASGNQDGISTPIGMFKSTDGGITWAEVDAAGAPSTAGLDSQSALVTVPNAAEGRFFTCALHPTLDQIWVVFLASGSDNYHGELACAKFDCGTGLWNPAILSGLVVDLSPSYNAGANFHQGQIYFKMSGDFDTNSGEFFLLYTQLFNNYTPDTSPGASLRFSPYSAKFNGTAWTDLGLIPGSQAYPVAFPGDDTVSQDVVSVNRGTSGRVHAILYQGGTPFGLVHYLLSDGAGGVGTGLEAITGDELQPAFQFNGPTYGWWTWQPLTLNGTQLALMVQNSTTGAWGLVYATSADTPIWSYTPTPTADWADGGPKSWSVVSGGNDNLIGINGSATGWNYTPWDGSTFGSVIPFWNVDPADAYAVSGQDVGTIGILYSLLSVTDPITGAPMVLYSITLTPDIPIVGSAIVGANSVPSGGGNVVLASTDIPLVGDAIVGGHTVFSSGGSVTGGGGGGGGFIPVQSPGGVFPLAPWPPDYQFPNMYDCCLQKFKELIRAHPLQDPTRCIVCHEHPDGLKLPYEAREFWETSSIVTPAYNPAVQVQVVRFQVPSGWSGMIYGLTFQYTGTGFEEGSGDIVWRLKVGQAWARDLGNSLTTLGTVGQCFPLNDYISLVERQYVTVYVQVPNLSGNIQVGASRILATVQGWYYPIQG